MEKLRKRYRAEKQRIGALPSHHNFVGNRFFPSSSWVFFDLMDAMEVGSVPGSGPGSTTIINNTSNGIGNNLNHVHNHNNNNMGMSMNMNVQNPPKENLQNGVFVKEEKMRGKDDLGKYFDEILMGMGKGVSGGPIKFRLKNQTEGRFPDESKYEGYEYDGNGSGFDYKSGRSFGPGGFSKRKLGGEDSSSKMYLNGCSSKKGFGLGSGSGSGSRGGRVRDPAAGEMVASIKLLGEALVRTEKEKMEMMQEFEMKRMEMELKRTQMILEAQHSIVEAFVQGLKKQKKVKVLEQD